MHPLLDPWCKPARISAVLFLCLILIQASVSKDIKTYRYQNKNDSAFTHMAYFSDSGVEKIYIGAANKLIQLNISSDGSLVEDIVSITGPKYDSLTCDPANIGTDNCNSSTLVLTDNVNQILLVSEDERALITCGSVFQGTCQLRDLANITNVSKESDTKDSGTWVTLGQKYVYSFLTQVDSQDHLVVGLTHINVDPYYRDVAYSFSMRQLENGENAFKVKLSDELTPKKIIAKEGYTIYYQGGFADGNFTYMLTNQHFLLNSTKMESKIQRVCKNDDYVTTLIDMKISCHGSKNYSLLTAASFVESKKFGNLLVAGFTDGDNPEDLDEFRSSALCMFLMSEVEQVFQKNLDQCLNGSYPKTLNDDNFYWREKNLVQDCPRNAITGKSCDIKGFPNGLIGLSPLISEEVEELSDNGYITGIRSLELRDKKVALFLGTSKGKILKGNLDNQTGHFQWKKYEEVLVEDHQPINNDLLFDQNKSHILAMTSGLVMRVPVQNCSQHKDCKSCLQSKDTFCGWCVLTKRCRILEHCPDGDIQNRWKSAVTSDKCLNLTVSPLTIEISNIPIQLNLTVKDLPGKNQNERFFLCSFGVYGTTNLTEMDVEVMNKGDITCPTPSNVTITGSKKTIRFGLVSNIMDGEEQPFVVKDITFINCSAITTSCNDCVTSNVCVWCIYSNECTNTMNTGSVCPQPRPGDLENIHVSMRKINCPVITGITPKAIPANVSKKIQFKGQNFPKPFGNQYVCKVRDEEFKADWQDKETVDCTVKQLIDKGVKGKIPLTVELLFTSDKTNVPHPVAGNKGPVTFYDCGVLGTDCSTCGSYNSPFNPHFDCHWCGGRCQYSNDSCQNSACPSPVIDEVTPLSCHTRGGTEVTIRGKELGRGPSDVKHITLAGLKCKISPAEFQVSTRVVCITEAGLPGSGNVQITVSQKTVTSNLSKNFIIVDPAISDIRPTKGPMAGGTRLTIQGNGLLVGKGRSVTLKSNNVSAPCNIVDKTSSNRLNQDLVCETTAVNETIVLSKVEVKIDGSPFSKALSFNYTEDPTLIDMMPKKSFASGGRMINVTGTNLDSIQTPKLFLIKHVEGESLMCSEAEECDHSVEDNSSLILCPTPTIVNDDTWMQCDSETLGIHVAPSSRREKRQAEDDIRVHIKMDGVISVQNSNFRLDYFPDPFYNNLTENSAFKPETLLYIAGKNLTLAATKNDISVSVCAGPCPVTNLNNTILVCTLPKSLDECPENEIPVEVTVGYANYYLGNLVIIIEPSPLKYILPPVCVIVVLVIILLVIAFKYRKHKHKRRKDMLRLQNQYELLERSVRQEARQEFADLQQDIKLVTSDVVMAGVPYKPLSHYTYAMLYPADLMGENHLLNNSQISIDIGWQEQAKKLDSLILNKFFLLTTLRSLEAEKKLSARDKSSLANVLTVILLDKLDYLLEIWKELLKEHVAKAVDKKQQKQVMRRNESIVEKLVSNWVALCMFNNLQNDTGSSLFMLYKATEMLTNYGAADAITGEAHYTLSEERLLKETVSTNPLTVHVMVNGEEFPCKVLDCDTVSQAKQKFLNQIYMSVPASSRPRQDQVDLEWQWGKNGRLILDDFDNTSEVDGDWKRLNTLKHYNVMNDSVMALLSKEDEGIESDSPFANFGRSSENLIHPSDVNVDMDCRLWHLVRKSDEIEATKQRIIQEIYLPRLVTTKVPLVTYLDHFVETVFNPNIVPKAIKYLFDYFDELLQLNGIQDVDVGHVWKSNSLPIRYWGSLLKAPHHAFDVNIPDLCEPSLDVLAQCFIDSCSLSEFQLGKDSPASKLLFCRDVQRYRHYVTRFYNKIIDTPMVTNEEAIQEIGELSNALRRNNLFNTKAALYDFCKVIQDHHENIIAALEENPDARKLQLGHKLEEFLDDLSI